MDDVVTQAAAQLVATGEEAHHIQFGVCNHESIQYNFFVGESFFSVRVIETRSLAHQSVWIYDHGIHELLNETAPIERIGTGHLEIETPRLHLTSDDSQGSVTASSAASASSLEIKFTIPVSSSWGSPGMGAGLHQPLLQGEIAYGGETLEGVGYCKRYWFEEDLGYMAWRFIAGELNGGASMLWTADATFGHSKYDYFKIAYPDGVVLAADNTHTHHRDDTAYGAIDGAPYEVGIEEIAEWSTRLRSDEMDLKLRKRFCKLALRHAVREETGYALNETGIGSIW